MREDALRRGPSPSVHKYQLVAFMTSPVTSVRPDLINSLAVDLSRLEVEDIPDPWYGTEPDYHAVYELLDEATDAIIKRYRNEKNV